MTPNWFEDGQHILILVTGTIAALVQAATFWQGVRNARKIADVHSLVTDTSGEMLAELETAQASITHVTALLDRRKGTSWPPWPGGRRAADPPKLLTEP